MGLIKSMFGAASSSVSSTMADQWKEYFAINAMEKDVLMCRGQKTINGKSSNDASNNVITDGSGISIADGQCAIIVEQGKVVELCAEPGVFTYSNKTAPSVFTGTLGESVRQTFDTIFQRFTMGGGTTGADQRVYYFNLKEIMENRYGTATPIPFRVVGRNNSFDLDTSVKCNGQYSYRIVDPLLFYTNVAGNVTHQYRRAEIDSTLKTELLTALQPALGEISAKGIRYSDLPAHAMDIADALNTVLSRSWVETRGIKIVSFGINSVTIPQEDAEQIRQLQLYENPNLAAANLAAAQADAMRSASSNAAGSLHGFMGMNMAGAMGGMNAASMFQAGQQMGQGMYQTAPMQQGGQAPMQQGGQAPMQQGGQAPMQQGGQAPMQQGGQAPQNMASPTGTQESGWDCSCGTNNNSNFCNNCGSPKPKPIQSWQCTCLSQNTGKFCSNCGEKQPVPTMGWHCRCGATNPGHFCMDCGKPKPIKAAVYRCDKCGFNPPDPENPPKFCPECGDNFNIDDKV